MAEVIDGVIGQARAYRRLAEKVQGVFVKRVEGLRMAADWATGPRRCSTVGWWLQSALQKPPAGRRPALRSWAWPLEAAGGGGHVGDMRAAPMASPWVGTASLLPGSARTGSTLSLENHQIAWYRRALARSEQISRSMGDAGQAVQPSGRGNAAEWRSNSFGNGRRDCPKTVGCCWCCAFYRIGSQLEASGNGRWA